jgi:hypothetical protein
MEYSPEELQILKEIFGDGIKKLNEGGFHYFLIPSLRMPDGCSPDVVDGLLCPIARDGYPSRLYLSSKVSFSQTRNWNGSIFVANRNWYAISWKIAEKATLAQMISMHLGGFRC